MKLFRLFLRLLPEEMRAGYARDMEADFAAQRREAHRDSRRVGRAGLTLLWLETLGGILRTAPREHWDMLRRDARFAGRMLRRNPGFSLLVVATLALGIGANTAIFSVVNAVLLRPLPYSRSEQLVFLRPHAQGVDDIQWSVPEIEDFRHQNRSFSALVEFHTMSFILYGHGDPQRVKTGVVSWNYFDTFGVKPLLGRGFVAADDQPKTQPVLVLSYEYWRREYGGNPAVVGQQVTMNDKTHIIVGVLPPIPQYPRTEDVYMPTSACPFRSSAKFIANREARMMEVFGRMRPGVNAAQAQADVATIAARLRAAYPQAYKPGFHYEVGVTPLKSDLTRNARPFLLVLLVACANAANLVLARMGRRGRELSIRMALGAGRSRLLRQLLTENFMLAAIAGAAAVGLAALSLSLLTRFVSRLTPRAGEIHLDLRVLLFTLAVALGTSVVCGSLAAMGAQGGSREGGAGAGWSRRSRRLRSGFIVAQVAFSCVLLIGAGLMVRSLMRMLATQPGFTSAHALAMNVSWGDEGNEAALSALENALVARMERIPGVAAAGLASNYPLQPEVLIGGPNTAGIVVAGRPTLPNQPPTIVDIASVSPDYFRAMGIPLLAGRGLSPHDNAAAPSVVVINRSLASAFWPRGGAIGQRISGDGGKEWFEVVGVAGDVRDLGVNHAPMLQAYGALAQSPMNLGTVVVRTFGDPLQVSRQVAAALHAVDPKMAISQVQSLDQALANSLAPSGNMTRLLLLFSGLALLIAVAGISGAMALRVTEQTREIGIRMALGAAPESVWRRVVGQGLKLAALGAALGLLAALGLTGWLRSLLFEIQPTDPATFTLVAALAVTAGIAASYLPARRAARIAPADALRSE